MEGWLDSESKVLRWAFKYHSFWRHSSTNDFDIQTCTFLCRGGNSCQLKVPSILYHAAGWTRKCRFREYSWPYERNVWMLRCDQSMFKDRERVSLLENKTIITAPIESLQLILKSDSITPIVLPRIIIQWAERRSACRAIVTTPITYRFK